MVRYIFSHIWLMDVYGFHVGIPKPSTDCFRTVPDLDAVRCGPWKPPTQCGVLWHGFSKAESGKSMIWVSTWMPRQSNTYSYSKETYLLDIYIYIRIYIGAVCFLFRSSHLIMQNYFKALFFTNSFRFAVVFLKKISLQLIKVWWWFRFIHNRWVNQWVQIQKAF